MNLKRLRDQKPVPAPTAATNLNGPPLKSPLNASGQQLESTPSSGRRRFLRLLRRPLTRATRRTSTRTTSVSMRPKNPTCLQKTLHLKSRRHRLQPCLLPSHTHMSPRRTLHRYTIGSLELRQRSLDSECQSSSLQSRPTVKSNLWTFISTGQSLRTLCAAPVPLYHNEKRPTNVRRTRILRVRRLFQYDSPCFSSG